MRWNFKLIASWTHCLYQQIVDILANLTWLKAAKGQLQFLNHSLYE